MHGAPRRSGIHRRRLRVGPTPRWVPLDSIAASVISATIPSGILLATSTDNDYFAAATGIGVLVILATFSLGSRWGYRAIALGAALGLCYLAKSTMALLLVPAVLSLLAIAGFRQMRTMRLGEHLRRGTNQVLVIAASALAVAGRLSGPDRATVRIRSGF